MRVMLGPMPAAVDGYSRSGCAVMCAVRGWLGLRVSVAWNRGAASGGLGTVGEYVLASSGRAVAVDLHRTTDCIGGRSHQWVPSLLAGDEETVSRARVREKESMLRRCWVGCSVSGYAGEDREQSAGGTER